MTNQNALRRTLISTAIAFILAFVAYTLSQSHKAFSSKDQKVNQHHAQSELEPTTTDLKTNNALTYSKKSILN